MLLRICGLLLFFTVACRSTSGSDSKDIKDMISATVGSDGMVTVACSNTTPQIQKMTIEEFRKQISNGTICGGTTAAGPGVFCKPYTSSMSYVARVSDGEPLTTNAVSNEQCDEIVKKVRNGIVCAPYTSSSAYVYSIKDSQKLGDAVDNQMCFKIIANLRNDIDLICRPYTSSMGYLTPVGRTASDEMGQAIQFETCFELQRAATQKAYCKPYTSSASYIARISDAKNLGTNTVGHELCKDILTNSRNDLICEPYTSSQFYVTNIVTMKRVGGDQTVPLDRCAKIIRDLNQ